MPDVAHIQLGSEILDIKDEVARNRLNRLDNRKLIIFGDSYFRNPAVSGDRAINYYLDAFFAPHGIVYEINSQGGEAFGAVDEYSYLYDVNNFVSSIPANEVTDIMFCGGFNDRDYTIAQIETGIDNACAAARAKYPNAKIHLGHFGWSAETGLATNRTKMVEKTIPAYRNCVKYGAAYMINSEYTMHAYDFFINDKVHPNNEGTFQIAKQITLYLLTGSCDVHYNTVWVKFNTEDGTPAQWTNSAYTVGSKLDNGVVTIFIPNAYISYGSVFTLEHSYWVSLCNLASTIEGYRLHFIGLYSDYNLMAQITLRGNFTLQGTTDTFLDFNEAECSFTISEGDLKVNVHKMKLDHSGYEPVANVKGVNIVGQAVTIPTLTC